MCPGGKITPSRKPWPRIQRERTTGINTRATKEGKERRREKKGEKEGHKSRTSSKIIIWLHLCHCWLISFTKGIYFHLVVIPFQEAQSSVMEKLFLCQLPPSSHPSQARHYHFLNHTALSANQEAGTRSSLSFLSSLLIYSSKITPSCSAMIPQMAISLPCICGS